MERFGISVDVKNKPVLDPEFIPMLKFNRAFLQDAKKPVSGVTIQAGEKSGQTDARGQLVLAGIPTNSVTVHALLGLGTLELPEYVNANDAALVLKYSVGTQVLSEHQKLAADVNGDGQVNILDYQALYEAYKVWVSKAA